MGGRYGYPVSLGGGSSDCVTSALADCINEDDRYILIGAPVFNSDMFNLTPT